MIKRTWTKTKVFASEHINFKLYAANFSNGSCPIVGSRLTFSAKLFLSCYVNGSHERVQMMEDAGWSGNGSIKTSNNSQFSMLSNNKFLKYDRKNGWAIGENGETYFQYILSEATRKGIPGSDIVNFGEV